MVLQSEYSRWRRRYSKGVFTEEYNVFVKKEKVLKESVHEGEEGEGTQRECS